MEVTDLKIRNCEKKFAETIQLLYILYQSKTKFNFEFNSAGNGENFSSSFNKIDTAAINYILTNKTEGKLKNE